MIKNIIVLFFSLIGASYCLFSSSVPVENTSEFTPKVRFDNQPPISLSPSVESLSIPSFAVNCTVYMDSLRYVTYKISKAYFFLDPKFDLYKDVNGKCLSVSNGEVSNIDEFVRFGDGINGIRVKFTSPSSGMSIWSTQTLTIGFADNSNTAKP